ncbi:hypothetical protein [Endozoicomonas lisbonensis]|uniref:MFS superfamily sulfate permease-like transporter n=1 Tax=Endozoicomonas lisbonensis TaxID=3120522 RepID=A0ABV2SNQ4_9GAMM
MTIAQVLVLLFFLLALYFLGQLTIGSLIRLFSKRLTLGFVVMNALAFGLFILLSTVANLWDILGVEWSDINPPDPPRQNDHH